MIKNTQHNVKSHPLWYSGISIVSHYKAEMIAFFHNEAML